MMPNPKRTLRGHAFTHNPWCLGFSLLLLIKKSLLLPFVHLPPSLQSLFALSLFFGHFSSSLVMFIAHCGLSNSFFFFSLLCLSCSLLFCCCSCSNGAHNTCIVLYLVVMFNMVICLNWHLSQLAFVVFCSFNHDPPIA
jgi:hypothetical protein